MRKANCTVKAYCRKVGSLLPCSFRKKKFILSGLKAEMCDFLEQNPTCGKEELYRHFGNPEETAAGYVDAMQPGELLQFLNLRRFAKGILLGLSVAAILLFGSYCLYAHTVFHGFSSPVYDLTIPTNAQEEGQS